MNDRIIETVSYIPQKPGETRENQAAFAQSMFFHLTRSLTFSSEKKFLQSLIKILMETLEMNVGGYIKWIDGEGYRLIHLVDDDNALAAQLIPKRREAVFNCPENTPHYLKGIWKVGSVDENTPQTGAGIDYWMPLSTQNDRVDTVIFLDDTNTDVDLHGIYIVMKHLNHFVFHAYTNFVAHLKTIGGE